MANLFYRIVFCLILLACFFLTCETQSLSTAWSKYSGGCKCGNKHGYKDNCAHYLSHALIRAGYSELDGGTGLEKRIVNGFAVCSAGRPIRAKELRSWFSRKWTRHSTPRDGINVVYQERADGQGHVLLKMYSGGKNTGFRGTGDYPNWPTQEYYY